MPQTATSLNKLIDQFAREWFKLYNQQPFKQVVIALSGGVDSMCLANLSHELQKRHLQYAFNLHSLIVNHNLRPDSLEEATQVANWCKERNWKVKLVSLDPKRKTGNTSHWARQQRYYAIAHYAQELNADLVITGHHFNDYLETACLQINRKAGLKGLTSLIEPVWLHTTTNQPPFYSTIRCAKPLIWATKQALYDYAMANELPFVEDPTNRNLRYQRNWIRHKLKPMLTAMTEPNTLNALQATLTNLQQTQDYIDFTLQQALNHLQEYPLGGLHADYDWFCNLHEQLQLNLLQLLSANASPKGYAPKHKKIQLALNNLHNNQTTSLGHLLLYRKNNRYFNNQVFISPTYNDQLDLTTPTKRLNNWVIDKDLLQQQLPQHTLLNLSYYHPLRHPKPEWIQVTPHLNKRFEEAPLFIKQQVPCLTTNYQNQLNYYLIEPTVHLGVYPFKDLKNTQKKIILTNEK